MCLSPHECNCWKGLTYLRYGLIFRITCDSKLNEGHEEHDLFLRIIAPHTRQNRYQQMNLVIWPRLGCVNSNLRVSITYK